MCVTNFMIRKYNLIELGYDFMGYSLQRNDRLTFHHLIIPTRLGGHKTIENGAILCGFSSHTYLHLIEHFDYKKFFLITNEMVKMNLAGKLDIASLKIINKILCEFERDYKDRTNSRNEKLIKEKYKIRVFN